MHFLDDESQRLHKEYLNELRIKYSILEKENEAIIGKSYEGLLRMPLKNADREEALRSFCEIRLHELFFSSFCDTPFPASTIVKRQYKSEAALLNLLFREGRKSGVGFLSIGIKGELVCPFISCDVREHFKNGEPLLAIDLFEHAYFLDYYFRKEDYLKQALTYLDLSLLDKKLKTT